MAASGNSLGPQWLIGNSDKSLFLINFSWRREGQSDWTFPYQWHSKWLVDGVSSMKWPPLSRPERLRAAGCRRGASCRYGRLRDVLDGAPPVRGATRDASGGIRWQDLRAVRERLSETFLSVSQNCSCQRDSHVTSATGDISLVHYYYISTVDISSCSFCNRSVEIKCEPYEGFNFETYFQSARFSFMLPKCVL